MSFIENVNALAGKLDIIIESNSIFDDGVIPVLEEIAALDLQNAVEDLKKGTFLGNRKLDIDLSLNKVGIESTNTITQNLAVWNTTATTVYYNKATVTFVDGVVIEVPFVNDDLSPLVISNHGSLVYQLLRNTTFTTKLVNTGIFDDVGGSTGTLTRVYDIIGSSSNVERIQLNAVSGNYKVQNPIYYWGLTTSSFKTLAMRASDIIKLGNSIDKIIVLANRIDEMLSLQSKLPELVTNVDSLYTNIAKLVTIHAQINGITAIYNDIKVGGTNYINTASADLLSVNSKISTVATDLLLGNLSKIKIVNDAIAYVTTVANGIANINTVASNEVNINTVAAQNTNINTLITNLTAIQNASSNAANAAASASLASAKASAILGLTTQATTLAAGSLATVSYNPVDGKMTFGIPQGAKGDRGDAFTVNSVGLAADRSIYDAQIKGFSFLAIDSALIYFKLSNTAGDWSIGAPFGKGDTGATGATGNGIASIAFLSTTDVSGLAGKSGATDTYRITNTDATTYNFSVYNGKDAGAASTIAFTPNGDIAATNVQAAIQEVRDDLDTKLGAKANQATTYTKSEDDAILNGHKIADDHTQYHNDTRGDARYYTKAQVDSKTITKLDYVSSSNLRSLDGGSLAYVEGLGLFYWSATDSSYIDDGEMCFATTNGQWVLKIQDSEHLYNYFNLYINDSINNLASLFENTILKATFSMTLTSLASLTATDFTFNVSGASLGDAVFATAGDGFGTASSEKAKLHHTAYVSGVGVVTVSIRNASASTATLSASTWNVIVIKK